MRRIKRSSRQQTFQFLNKFYFLAKLFIMICCLCLKHSQNISRLFDDADDKEEIMATLVRKYFWFEPCKDDPMVTAICSSCRMRLYDFHQFYEMVENAHKSYRTTESVIIKTEQAPLDFDSIPNKHVTTDVFNDEFSEVPFPMTAANRNVANSLDTLSQQNDVVNDNVFNESNDNEGTDSDGCNEEECADNHDDSDESDPIYEVNISYVDKHLKNESLASSQEVLINKKRITRSSSKHQNWIANKTKTPTKAKTKILTKEKTLKDSLGSTPKTRKTKVMSSEKNCEEQTAYKDKMKSFDAQISQYMGLHCDVCNVAAENFASLKLHMRNEHNMENGYVKCCDKKFHRRANLLYHIRHHVDPDCYRCEECNRAFSDYQSLRNHINVKHQKEEDKIYECTECSKKFAKKYLLEQHKTFKHKDRSMKCKMCNRRHDTAEELAEHNKVPCVAGIMCDICAKVIYGPAAFKRHQLDHEDGQANREQCDLCGSWHRDKYALRKHKRRHLEPKKPHVCDICNKISPSREAMISHKRYAHSTERSFECEFCQKSFKKALSLKEHMTTHTGEVLYTCPHCPKTFNSNANMHSHRKNAHPREFEEARKRRKRVAYVSDQRAIVGFGSTTNISTVLNDNVNEQSLVGAAPDLTSVKPNDTLMVFSLN